MHGCTARDYAGPSDLPLLIRLAQRLTVAALPGASYYHPGDIAWQLYASDASDDVRVWERPEGEAAAVGIFEPPLNVQFGIDATADATALTDEILAWAEARRALVARDAAIPRAYDSLGDDALATSVMDGDAERIALLQERGYARADRGGIRFARSLDAPTPSVSLHEGARFRTMTDADAETRAELHRDAWSPWGQSQFSTGRYRRLRAAPLYDADLDIVLEHDGALVSYCVCWADEASGVGYFEPAGTRPTATGRGFGRAVIREGMRRLRERGMRVAMVGTASINEAAAALYRSAGFDVIGREHFWVKRV